MSDALIAASRALADRLRPLSFSTASHVYLPLDYARGPHELYLRRFGGGKKRVVFLGMNPGPFGMAQTGVPFGEIAAVRDWMGISAPVGKPAAEHPKRPVQGFDCPKSEVSGRRLWGLFSERFPVAGDFFRDHFVLNYCPLVWMNMRIAARILSVWEEFWRGVPDSRLSRRVILLARFASRRESCVEFAISFISL